MNVNKWLKKLNTSFYGKTVVLTGAGGGIGRHIAQNFVKLNANLILAVNNMQRGRELKNKLITENKNCKVSVVKLDLSDTQAISEFANKVAKICPEGIDYLVNNAGIFRRPKCFNKHGFEIHHAINYFGTVYLTLKMLPLLNLKRGSKVVFQSSVSSQNFEVDWKDSERLKTKNKIKVYAQTKKLLNLTSYCFNDLFKNVYPNVSFVLTHPGISGTDIVGRGKTFVSAITAKVSKYSMKILFHSPQKASLPVIYAVVNDVDQSSWVGPRGAGQVRGKPKIHKFSEKYFDTDQIIQLKSLIKCDLYKGGVHKELEYVIELLK